MAREIRRTEMTKRMVNPHVMVDLLCSTCAKRWTAWMPEWWLDRSTGLESSCVANGHQVGIASAENPE